MKKLILLLVLLFSMAALVTTVQAALVSGEFSGTITSVLDPSGLLSGSGITPGSSTFTGTFSYDSSTLPDGATGYNNVSILCTVDGVGSFRFKSPDGQSIVMQADNANGDDLLLFTDATESFSMALSAFLLNRLEESLLSEYGISLAGVDGPADGLEISINEITDDQSGYSIGGIVTCFRVVPVPGAVWLLASGLLGLVGVRRRLKR